MGILDILGKIPGISLNIANKNINVQITNSGIQIDGKDVDPKLRKSILDELALGREKDSYECDVIHKDLLEDYESLDKIFIENKDSLKLLKRVLSEDYFEEIIMARRIYLAIKKNCPKVEIKKLISKMDKEYPRDGKKILNLISAGYFDEIVFPMIKFFIEKDPQNYAKEFSDFFYSILKFFPIAIFVNNDVPESIISEELGKRLKLKKIPHIKIHAIGSNNISKMNNVVSKMKNNDKFFIEKTKFTAPGGLSAQITTIKLSNG